MIFTNLLELAGYVFIRLNEKNDIRKIYLDDLLSCNVILKKEAKIRNIEYFCETDYENHFVFRNNSKGLFVCFEGEDGYVIKLSNGLDIESLEKKIDTSKLDVLTENINLDEIFKSLKKTLKI